MKDWIVADFSTSTQDDIIVSKLALMGAMQHYFSYTADFRCGIPSVNLLGTLDDWKKLEKECLQFQTLAQMNGQGHQNLLLMNLSIRLKEFKTKVFGIRSVTIITKEGQVGASL